jgi:hypothetical protein
VSLRRATRSRSPGPGGDGPGERERGGDGIGPAPVAHACGRGPVVRTPPASLGEACRSCSCSSCLAVLLHLGSAEPGPGSLMVFPLPPERAGGGGWPAGPTALPWDAAAPMSGAVTQVGCPHGFLLSFVRPAVAASCGTGFPLTPRQNVGIRHRWPDTTPSGEMTALLRTESEHL